MRHSLLFPRSAIAIASLISIGCDGTTATTVPLTNAPAPTAIASIKVEPNMSDIELGSSVPVTAVVQDGNGNPLRGWAVSWTSGDTSIAIVTSTGALTASIETRGGGRVMVIASAQGRSGAIMFNVAGSQAFIYSAAEGMRLIPIPAGAHQSGALAINDAGQVVGYTRTAMVSRPFLWSRGTGDVDLGSLPGAVTTGAIARATAINNAGEVAGWAYGADNRVHAFKWTASTRMLDLGIPTNGMHSFAAAINDSGVVVGSTWMQNGPNGAFRWSQSRGMELLGGLDGNGARANGINTAGQIVGALVVGEAYWEEDAGGTLWSPRGARVDIGTCKCISADAVNSAGEIVGLSRAGHPFRWTQAGGLVELTSIRGRATAINDVRQVVGLDDSGRGFLWTEVNGTRVVTMLPAGTHPTGINQSGKVVGSVRF